MDARWRRFTAELLYRFLIDPSYPAHDTLQRSGLEAAFPNWYQLLDKLLTQEDLRQLTAHHEEFAFSVARETLAWCRETYQRFEASHAYREEQGRLDFFRHHLTEAPHAQWLAELDYLVEHYPSHRLSWQFYRETLGQMDPEAGTVTQDLRVLRQQILSEWGRFLEAKKAGSEGTFYAQTFDVYYEALTHKVQQLQAWGDLIGPFYNFLGHVWNDGLGSWNRIPWDKMEAFAKRLERDPQLRELANLLGRWQEARREEIEQLMEEPLARESWTPSPYGKSEIIGIHHSDDLSALLPSEVALLSSVETGTLFSLKYVEKKLLTFQYRSQERSPERRPEEVTQVERSVDQPGPFFICVDTSGSMFGAPERIAKALALALLEMALHQHRRVFLISFSTGIQTIEMTGIEQDLGRFIDFLSMSFHGGTDLQPALREVLDQLETERYAQADVLVLSDFAIPRLDRQTYDRIQRQRHDHGTSFHSLYIARRPEPTDIPAAVFDHHWTYDLDDPKVLRRTVDRLQQLRRPLNLPEQGPS